MPCCDNYIAHESQRFLYNPNTGVIHPDWTPSSTSQQLLQSMPDSVDDDSEQDFTSAFTASPTAMAAEAMQTGSDNWYTYSDSASPESTVSPKAPYMHSCCHGHLHTSSSHHLRTFHLNQLHLIKRIPFQVTLIFSPANPSLSKSGTIYQPDSDADASQVNVRRQYDESKDPFYSGEHRGSREQYTEDPSKYSPDSSYPSSGSKDVSSSEDEPYATPAKITRQACRYRSISPPHRSWNALGEVLSYPLGKITR